MSDLAISPLIADLRKVVQRIALVSHAPTQSYHVVLPPDDIPRTPDRWRSNGNRPPVPHLGAHQSKSGDTAIPQGSIDRQGDFKVDYRQKSHVYFQHRLDRLLGSKKSTEADLEALLAEAREVLKDWMKTPEVAGVELERDSFRWKCAIADDDRPRQSVADSYSVSPATVYRYRKELRGMFRAVPS